MIKDNGDKIIIQPGHPKWGKLEGLAKEEDPKLAKKIKDLREQEKEQEKKTRKRVNQQLIKDQTLAHHNKEIIDNFQDSGSDIGAEETSSKLDKNSGVIITPNTPAEKENVNKQDKTKKEPTIYTASGIEYHKGEEGIVSLDEIEAPRIEIAAPKDENKIKAQQQEELKAELNFWEQNDFSKDEFLSYKITDPLQTVEKLLNFINKELTSSQRKVDNFLSLKK